MSSSVAAEAGSNFASNRRIRRAAICGFSANASFWYSSVNAGDTRWRYLRYARTMATSRHVSPAKITSRLSESDSASPRHTAAIVSATRSAACSRSSTAPRASSTPKSWM